MDRDYTKEQGSLTEQREGPKELVANMELTT